MLERLASFCRGALDFTKKSAVLLSVCLLALQAISCANLGAWVRQYTYPPTFHYITDEQLRSTMWRLAFHSRELHNLIARDATASQRGEVLQHLRIMEQATLDLNRTSWPTNHPLVDAKRPTFLRDIKNAQDAAGRDPPSFLLAGTVSGACAYCHPSR